MYQSANLRVAHVFYSDGRSSEVDKSQVNALQILDDPATVFISDSLTPPVVRAFSVLITSPRRERWYGYLKERDAARLIFPVFSWEEIQRMQAACFPHVEGGEDGVAERYARWGGIPRYVLAKTDTDSQMFLESALSRPDYQQLSNLFGTQELESEAVASHRLLHLKTAGELDPSLLPSDLNFYNLARMELGSSHIADRVYQQISSAADNQLQALLASHLRNESVSKLYGDVFERFARDALQAGGTFRVRRLQSDGKGSDSDLRIEPSASPVSSFRQVQELVGTASDRILQPRSKGFCAIDFIFQGRRPANATINQQHILILRSKGKPPGGLFPVADALEITRPVEFFWVVPEVDFREWTKPLRLYYDGQPAPQMAEQVKQYALAIPFKLHPSSRPRTPSLVSALQPVRRFSSAAVPLATSLLAGLAVLVR